MKKVCLQFMGMGIKQKCQAKVVVCDLRGCMVAKGVTKNGIFCFTAKEKSFYKIKYSINGLVNNKTIYINNNNYYPLMYQGMFVNQTNRSKAITFLLTDSFYHNLPINKGEMVLWQNK